MVSIARMAAHAAVWMITATGAMAQTIVSSQQAGLTANSNTITAARVPVQVGTGAPSYFDVTINLTPTMSGGSVTGLRATTKSSVPSQVLISDGFIPGTYRDQYGDTYTLGGGASEGGQTIWSLVLATCPSSYCISSATWDTDDGPNNPEYPLLKKYHITTTAFSFGASGGNCCRGVGSEFNNGNLIGAYQTGSTLSIGSFEDGNGTYYTSPSPGTYSLTYIGS